MTKSEIAEQYDINEQGIITSPGKFEREMYYAVSFWNSTLDGFCDRDEMSDDGTLVAIFDIRLHDIEQYPELEGSTELRIWEDENGFVFCTVD